jgi:DNA-directed RNA polymerase specialized sigma24 family protein
MNALNQLSPVQREVGLLADLEDWSHADIAAKTGLSVTMSRRHLSDARRKLRGLLASLGLSSPEHS